MFHITHSFTCSLTRCSVDQNLKLVTETMKLRGCTVTQKVQVKIQLLLNGGNKLNEVGEDSKVTANVPWFTDKSMTGSQGRKKYEKENTNFSSGCTTWPYTILLWYLSHKWFKISHHWVSCPLTLIQLWASPPLLMYTHFLRKCKSKYTRVRF